MRVHLEFIMIKAQLKEVCLAYREGIDVYERTFHFIQNKNPKMICNLEVTLFCWFDTGISFDINVHHVIWDE